MLWKYIDENSHHGIVDRNENKLLLEEVHIFCPLPNLLVYFFRSPFIEILSIRKSVPHTGQAYYALGAIKHLIEEQIENMKLVL